MNDRELAALIDHTLLKADATEQAVACLCDEAVAYGFAAVCLNPAYVETAKKQLMNSSVHVAAVVGFPLGASTTETKVFEAVDAAEHGADELDVVIAIGAARAGRLDIVSDELRKLRSAVPGVMLKVILETGYFNDGEKNDLCLLARDSGADCVKTSTGFGPSGATVDDIRLMRRIVGPTMGVKASGGIRCAADALRMVAAGASRIGTSQAVAIIKELRAGATACA